MRYAAKVFVRSGELFFVLGIVGIGAYPLYFQIDSHWNEEGQRVAAEYLGDILKRNYGMVLAD